MSTYGCTFIYTPLWQFYRLLNADLDEHGMILKQPPPLLGWTILDVMGGGTLQSLIMLKCTNYGYTLHSNTVFMCSGPSLLHICLKGKGKQELHIHSVKAHRTSRLTRRDEGVLDCIALEEVALYAVHTLNAVSVKNSHIAHSNNCHSML